MNKSVLIPIPGLDSLILIRSETPDRFLRQSGDPEEEYITAERLNKVFKMLEKRIEYLEGVIDQLMTMEKNNE